MPQDPETSNPSPPADVPLASPPSAEDTVKVVDRQGNVKVVSRSHFEQKKRHRKRREHKKTFPLKDVIIIVIIVAVMVVAAIVALKLVS